MVAHEARQNVGPFGPVDRPPSLFLGFGGLGLVFLIPAYFLFTIAGRTRKAAAALGN
jgi:hypothetical protein